jgi:8-oxo-dGTP diphosphatase
VTSRFVVVPAAYLVLRRGSDPGEVLLQLREGTGYMDGHWALAAAGHVEADESVFAAASREALEELGIVIMPQDLQPLCAMHRTGGNQQPIDERVDYFFQCRRWSDEPRLLEPDKAVDLRWFALDALPDPVVPHERFVLDHLAAGDLAPILTFGF